MLSDSRKRRQSRFSTPEVNESLRDKQETKRLDREARKALIDSRYNFLIDKVSLHFKMEKGFIIDCLTDGEQVRPSLCYMFSGSSH
ncbi:unnamed protein product [Heterobilharzia americana]|nr:unnamed protein product [Heterobilharzia americana]